MTTATTSAGETLSILSVQSCAVDGVSDIPKQQSLTAQDSSADMESLAPEVPPSAPAGSAPCVVRDDVAALQMELGEENVPPLKCEEKGTLVLTADVPVLAPTPQLHPISMNTSSVECVAALEKPSSDESAVGVKVCPHCGASTDRTRAKKCHSCHKFFVERGVSYPCPKIHPAGLPNEAPYQSNLVPIEARETGTVAMGNVDPKVEAWSRVGKVSSAWSGDCNSKAGNDSGIAGGKSSKGDCLTVQIERGVDGGTLLPSQARLLTLTTVAPTGTLALDSEQQECTVSATTRSGKMYKNAASSLEQPFLGLDVGGSTDVVNSSVASTLSSLVSMGNSTFALPLLHTTTVGAALRNISNSSLSSSSLENCFSPSLHPVTIDFGGTTSSRLVPAPTSAIEAITPNNSVAPTNLPGAKLNPLTSQLPVMIGMTTRATIGDALNYVMTRSSSQGVPMPPLIPALSAPHLIQASSSPPIFSAPSLTPIVSASSTPSIVSAPSLPPVFSMSPIVSAPSLPPIVSAPSLLPIVSAPSLPPIVSAPSLLPIVSAPSLLPIISASSLPPIVSAPSLLPIVSAPSLLPIVSAPSLSPIVSAPSMSPIILAPSLPPIVSAPSVSPIVLAPSLLPIISAPGATPTASCIPPVCAGPPNLVVSSVAFPSQGISTIPESAQQLDTSVSSTVGDFNSESAKGSCLNNSEEIAPAFSHSEPVASAQPSVVPSQQGTLTVVASDEGVVLPSEFSSQFSPMKTCNPTTFSPQSDSTEAGGKTTTSPFPPLLYKDGESPAPPTSGTGGERGSSHFFSAKFRNRYGHLEKGDGKGLKRVSYPDGISSAVKRMKGVDSSLPGSPDVFGVSSSQVGAQQPAALTRTDMLGGATTQPPRQVVAPVTTQFQRQTVVSKAALGGVTHQKVAGSSSSAATASGSSSVLGMGSGPGLVAGGGPGLVTGGGPGLVTGSGPGLVTGSGPGLAASKVPIRPVETMHPAPMRSPSNTYLNPSPLQALHLSLHSQNNYPPSSSLHSPVLYTSSICMATHGIHTVTPTSGLLPIPPLVKTSTVVTSQAPSSSLFSSSPSPSLVSSSSLLYANTSTLIQNVLLRPSLASSAVMGSVTAQLLKPQGEAKPGTTVVRVLSPTPALSSGSQLPSRNKVSATTVFPSIAMTTSLTSLPITAKSTLMESKTTILSQSGRENADKTGGTSARTSPPLISPGGSRAKVVYTSTITGPRSSPGAIEGGTDALMGKGTSTNKLPLAVPPPASDLQKLTCAIQSRIKQVLDKDSEPEQQKTLCSPSSPSPPPPPPPVHFASRPHTAQPPPKGMEGTCTSTWVPPSMGCLPALVGPPVVTAATSDRVVQAISDRAVQAASTDRALVSTSTERPVSTASVATFTERSVGTSTERSVSTWTERSASIPTERSIGTSTERSVGTSTERSMISYERVVSPLERVGSGSTEKGVATCSERCLVSGSERNASERPTYSSSPVATSSNQALQQVKEENETDVDGVAIQESDLKKNGENYSKLRSDEAMESGSEENSEIGNANTDSMDVDTQVFSVKLKDCFMHHVMWNNFKMVFLVPLLHESRLTASSELPAVKMEDVNSEEECGDLKGASPSSSQSGVPVTPCFSVYELRTKLFSSFSPSAVYVYTYKNNIRSYKPPIHWVYVMKRMGGVQDTCHTCRLLGMQHVKNICDYYRIRLPSILNTLGRNEIPPGRKVVDLSHVGVEELDQEHLDLIPSCAFVDTPSKAQSKLPRKRGRKYVQGEPSPPTPSEQSESVDNAMDQCDGYGGNSSLYRYQSVGKKKPCPQCGTSILKKCKKCPLCGKTFGLFAFGRRQCTSCGRVNLAKYTNCNKCGANLQNAPIALPKEDETRDSPQPSSEYVCKRRRLHNLPVTYSNRDHEDGEAPLGGPPLSRRASTTASDADEEMVDYGEEFDEEVDCPDDSEMSSAKSPTKSRHTGYQYGRVPWANTEVAVLVDEKGVLRFCLHELCTRVLTEHSKADVFNMVKDLNLPMEQGDMPLLKKLQALGMHSNRSPICRLIVAEDMWALLDALQEPVPDEVHQHLETVTLNAPFSTSYPSSPVPPAASRPSQLNISQSPESFSTPSMLPAVQDSPAMMLNPGTTPVVAEDESGFESTLHEMQCSDGQFVSILRAWNGGQYVCLPEVWKKYFPEVNRNNLTGVLKKLELDTHLPTGQQATLLRSAGVISLRGAPGRLMKLEDMQALLDSFGIPLQIGSGKALTPAKQVSNQTTPKPRPSNIVPKPILRVCDDRPLPVQKDNPANIDSQLAHCMQNILIALGSEDIETLLKECAQSVFEASSLAEQEAIGAAAELNGVEQLIAARRELCLVLNKEIGYLRATSQGYMAEIVRQNSVQRQALQDVEGQLACLGISLNSEDSIHNSNSSKPFV